MQHGHPWHVAPVALHFFARAAAELQHGDAAAPLGAIPGLDAAWVASQVCVWGGMRSPFLRTCDAAAVPQIEPLGGTSLLADAAPAPAAASAPPSSGASPSAGPVMLQQRWLGLALTMLDEYLVLGDPRANGSPAVPGVSAYALRHTLLVRRQVEEGGEEATSRRRYPPYYPRRRLRR